jgi:hypothetical protein
MLYLSGAKAKQANQSGGDEHVESLNNAKHVRLNVFSCMLEPI